MGSPSHPAGDAPADGASALVERALRESLRSYAHPTWIEGLLDRALASSGERWIPTESKRLHRFVTALGWAVQQTIGPEEADALEAELRPLLALSDVDDADDISQVRSVSDALPVPSMSSSVPPFEEVQATAPVPPRPVLLVSRSSERAERLAAGLSGAISVTPVADALALLDGAQQNGRPPVVVLDCDHPSVQPSTVGALGPELPPETRVVLWGTCGPDLEELRQLVPGADRWVACTSDDEDEAVAALIEELTG